MLIRKHLLNILICLFSAYFIMHSVYGERGLISYFKLSSSIEKKLEALGALEKERVCFEKTAHLLRSESLNKDFLEEKAKHHLGVRYTNEEVVK